jgi:hypothetical protein
LAGFQDRDPEERGQGIPEALPDPDGQVLRGWILKPRNRVEEIVVERLEHWADEAAEFAVVQEPPCPRIGVTLHHDVDPITVAVEPTTRVVGLRGGKKVGRFETELLTQSVHR